MRLQIIFTIFITIIQFSQQFTCHYSCLTCNGTTDADCTACYDATRTLTGSTCPCIDGYQDTSASGPCTQIACDYTCQTCNNTATFCLTCDSSKKRTQVGSTCPCDPKYFDAGTNIPLCANCDHSCATCDVINTNCTSCNSANHRTQNGSTCICDNLYYDDGTNQLCADCNYKCLTCTTSAVNCLTCGANRRPAPSCSCLDRFYDDGTSHDCQACQYSCLTCTSTATCVSCDSSTDHRGLQSSGVCGCLPRYYQASLNPQSCSNCHPTCLQCSGNLNTQCLACNSSAFRELSTTTCTCINGYYQTSSTTQLCTICHYTCLTCSGGSSTACVTCDSGLNRVKVGTSCSCISGFYLNSIGLCVNCHQNCLACNDGNSCSSCPAGSNRIIGSSNLCICDIGFFDIGVPTCSSCNYTCKTCQNSSTTCLSCPTSSFRTLFSTTCNCNTHYFDNSVPTCVVCHRTCQNCSAATATSCLTCSASNFRTKDTSNNSCPCNTGYYDDGSTPLCKKCHYTCQTCSGGAASTNCLSCSSLNHRTFSTNSCPCDSGYFNNGTNPLCTGCSYQCATCITNSTNCQTCAGNRLTTPGCTTCPIKFYDDFVSASCQACQYSCATCTNSTNCLTCNAIKFRQLSILTSYCACKIRYYQATVSTQLCTGCDATCLTCNGATASTCLSCNSSAFRNLSSTSCLCKNGYYQTSITVQLCSICHKSCLTCNGGGGATNCLTCDSSKLRQGPSGTNTCTCMNGYYQNSLLDCIPCNKNCNTCNNGTGCIDCPVGSNRVPTAPTNLCLCSASFYDIGNVTCLACHYSCGTCVTSSTNCLTCPVSSFRTLNNNTCFCNQHYYDNSVATCVGCSYTCSSCTNGTQCKTCNLITNHRKLTSSGTCVCDAGYFDDLSNQLCGTCLYQCLTCLDATTCASCDSALHRTLVGTLCPCDKYFYDDGVKLCKQCFYHCDTCTNGSACATCQGATNFRVMNASTAKCDCMPKYYDTGLNVMQCASCLYHCATCQNGTNCLTCDNTKNRTLNSANLCVCITGNYQSPTGAQTCIACPYKCLTCSNATGTPRCTTCDATKFRISNTSTFTCDCMVGYYDDALNNMLCLPCNYTCKSCTTLPACTSCDTTLRTFSGGSCLCFDKYWDNGVTMSCTLCDHSCATCDDAVSCLTCNSTAHRIPSASFCLCDVKFYDDGVNQLCRTCNYKCATCTNTSVCLTCNSSNFRSTPTSSCPCIDRHFDTGLNAELCGNCYYTCKTCTNATKCTGCQAANNRVYNSTTKACDCMTGYFDNLLNVQLCDRCDYRCLTCQTDQFTCTTCLSSNHRTHNTSNKCPCDQYYYDNGIPMCQNCQYTCETCSNGVSCDTCNASKFRVHNVTTDLCSPLIGYYDDNVNELAVRCHLSCLTCLNSTHCDTCDPLRFRMKNQSINLLGVSNTYCPCFYRYYDPGPSLNCQPCHYSCQVCSGGLSTQCDYCNTTAYRSYKSSTGQCRCTLTHYDDGSNQLCQNCSYLCKKCWDNLNTTCTQCHPTYFLLLSLTTCYVTCPSYYFNNTSLMQCTACSQYCLRCTDQDFCLECQTGKFLFLNTSSHFCLVSCPGGTYPNSTAKQCIYCPVGCATCTSNFDCQTCIDGYFLDIPLKLCYPCNSLCKTCTGPSQDNCLSCNYPLYYKNSKCYNLTCLFGQYVDPVYGCKNCSTVFSSSITCNLTQALSCQNTHHLVLGSCINCTSVNGYQLTSAGTCRQICGDGIKIQFQCDDGNILDGDGCSSSCTVQQGWACDSNSICTLQVIVQFNLKELYKYGGQNRVRLYFELSLPIRLSKNFHLIVQNVLASLFDYDWQQDQSNLKRVWLYLNYRADLNNKRIYISYNQSRLLLQEINKQKQLKNQNQIENVLQQQIRNRNLFQLQINVNFTLDTYPPAIYYSDPQITEFNILKSIIFYLCIALLVLCLILIPKRMHLHSITLFWIPTYIYFAYGLTLQKETDWTKSILLDIKIPALVYGISLGQCCNISTFFQFSSQIALSSGLIISILIAYWIFLIILMIIDSKWCKIPTALVYAKYHLITLHAFLIFHLVYTSILALYDFSITTEFDAFNITLGILMLVYFIAFISLMWDFTYATKFNLKSQDLQSNATHGSQFNSEVQSRFYAVQEKQNSVGNSSSMILKKNNLKKQDQDVIEYQSPKRQNKNNQNLNLNLNDKYQEIDQNSNENNSRDLKTAGRLPSRHQSIKKLLTYEQYQENIQTDFPFDYSTLYSGKRPKSKYFLPVYLTKLWVMSFICIVLKSYPLALYSILIVVEIIFIGFLGMIKPFSFRFTTGRLITLSIILIAVDAMFLVYTLQSQNEIYTSVLEVIMIYGILSLLIFALFSIIIQHILCWRNELWAKIQACLIYFRLKGRRRIYDAKRRQKQQSMIAVSQVQESDHQELDAFYARMIKKTYVNNKYRKERHMNPQFPARRIRDDLPL